MIKAHISLRTLTVLAALVSTVQSAVAQATWTGGASPDLNWSTGGNWSGGTGSGGQPASTDSVVFGDTGTVGDSAMINNTVDLSFAGTIAALTYNHKISGAYHVTEIPTGQTLSVSGNTIVGGLNANTNYTGVFMTGGGTFAPAGTTFHVGNQGADNISPYLHATLDMSGLSNFVYDVSGGTWTIAGGAGSSVARGAGVLNLAGASNNITVGTINFNIGDGNNSSFHSLIQFGAGTNILNVGNFRICAEKARFAEVQFIGSAPATAGLRLRGVAGNSDDASRATLTLGDRENSGTGDTIGQLLLNGHPVDIKVDTLTVGQNRTGSGSAAHSGQGIVQFDDGTLDANTVVMANVSGTGGTPSSTGTITVGANGTLMVGTGGISLVRQADGTATGNLNVSGGNLLCSGDIFKATTAGTGNITVDSGLLDMQPAGDPTPGNITADALTLGTVGTAVITNAATISTPTITIGFGGAIAGSTVIDIGDSGAGSIDASGAGSFTLAGTLKGSGNVSGDLTQDTGATISPNGAPGALTFNSNLTLGAGQLEFDLASSAFGVNDQLTVSGNLNLTGTNTVSLNATEGDFDSGSPYTLISYTGTLTGDETYFQAGGVIAQSRRTFTFSTNTANAITLTVGGSAPAALTWAGDGSANVWDINGAANWSNGVASDKFFNLDNVTFDDTGSNTPDIGLAGTLAPSSITVNNPTKDYTFSGSGSIGGSPALNKQGAAALAIGNTTANEFGAVTVDAGSLLISNSAANTFGAITNNGGAITVANSQPNTYSGNIALEAGSLTLNLAADATLANAISGAAGSLVKQDTNMLVLSGDNSAFDGPITVNAGLLKAGASAGVNQNSTVLGSTNGGTLIAAGATLDVNGYNLGLEPVTVSGTGVGGLGAIVENTGDAGFHSPGPNLAYITLTGDTAFGGTGRLDVRSDPATGTNAALSTGGQPYQFTKLGTNQLTLTGVQVDAALGDIDIQGGLLGLERATTFGNAQSNLFVRAGSTLLLFQIFSGLDKQIHLFGDGSNNTVFAQSGGADQNIVVGPVVLNGDCLINVASNQFATFSNSISGTGRLTKVDAGTLLLTGTGANNWSGGLVINGGTLQIGDGGANGSLPATAITNNGALAFNSASDFIQANEISGTGTLAKSGDGKLTLTGTHTYTGATTVSGGTLQVDGSLLGSGGITVSGGTLGGGGTMVGSVNVEAGGTLAPGASIGTLNVVGALSLAGTNVMELNKSGSTLTNDRVAGVSSLTLGGTLVLDVSGDPLAAGDAFQIYSATITLPGSFSSIEPATPGSGLAWDTSTLAADGMLRVAGSVNTTPTNIVSSVSGSDLTLNWPEDHTGWTLQVQTNALGVGLNTNWFDVADSAATNQVTVPIDPANPTVFYRLVYP